MGEATGSGLRDSKKENISSGRNLEELSWHHLSLWVLNKSNQVRISSMKGRHDQRHLCLMSDWSCIACVHLLIWYMLTT